MDAQRARELVARERTRIETSLAGLTGELSTEAPLEGQQTGETDAGSELATEMTEIALIASLREQLAAVVRAEARLAAGTYGRSIESGAVIPDERLEADPLAERTTQEQRQVEAAAR